MKHGKRRKERKNPKQHPTNLTPAPTTATLLPEPENPITNAINHTCKLDFEQLNQKIKTHELSNKSSEKKELKKMKARD